MNIDYQAKPKKKTENELNLICRYQGKQLGNSNRAKATTTTTKTAFKSSNYNRN